MFLMDRCDSLPLPLPAVAATINVLASMPFTAEEIVDILRIIEGPTIYEQMVEERAVAKFRAEFEWDGLP